MENVTTLRKNTSFAEDQVSYRVRIRIRARLQPCRACRIFRHLAIAERGKGATSVVP